MEMIDDLILLTFREKILDIGQFNILGVFGIKEKDEIHSRYHLRTKFVPYDTFLFPSGLSSGKCDDEAAGIGFAF